MFNHRIHSYIKLLKVTKGEKENNASRCIPNFISSVLKVVNGSQIWIMATYCFQQEASAHQLIRNHTKTVRRLADDEGEVYDDNYKEMINDDMKAGAARAARWVLAHQHLAKANHPYEEWVIFLQVDTNWQQ